VRGNGTSRGWVPPYYRFCSDLRLCVCLWRLRFVRVLGDVLRMWVWFSGADERRIRSPVPKDQYITLLPPSPPDNDKTPRLILGD
jgi:hypothetical protein